MGSAQKILNWKQVTAYTIGEPAPFDVAKPISNLQLTPKAIENLPKHPYQRLQFQWNGQTLHGGKGPWHGTYDVLPPAQSITFFMNPRHRWSIDKSLSWGEDCALPTGIVALIGIIFTGAGLLIRKGL